ncbi:zinc-dependent peptidase [Lacinutrix sp.]|uniref:zinc-dependent peptidase n=1 Tax=Lacinutrix sp. TaxID=1937692 RepID=UPI0025C1151A|nr:zinc-dependent peptidase [Lacinutrix sp.]
MLLILQSQAEFKENPLVYEYVTAIATIFLVVFVIVVILIWLFKVIEGLYVDFIGGKPFYRHFYFFVKELKPNQKKILENEFNFYKLLNKKEQRFFRHRVCKFINKIEFIGKEGITIKDEHLVLVSATAVMITFGFRKYLIEALDTIIIYPKHYYSKQSNQDHKGEYNPRMKALVLSWKDFIEGYAIEDDNLNLGIHEVVHAVHLNSLKEKDISAYLFKIRFIELTNFIEKNPHIREKLTKTKYIRDYAFTNHFEFVSVLVENFIETPSEFRSQFPEIYVIVKQMLNFNFAGY